MSARIRSAAQTALEKIAALRSRIAELESLLVRARVEIASELKLMIDCHRARHPFVQTDEQVLADDDHEEIDNESYAEMNRWDALVHEIDRALTGEREG
jgi:hypothetical protein